MRIRKIHDTPSLAATYFVYRILKNDSIVIGSDFKEKVKAGSIIANTIEVTEEDIKNWSSRAKELEKDYEYWGEMCFPENPENLSCSSCEYCIWTSHFKYCIQLNKRLTNGFKTNEKLKDCPF